MIGSLRLVLRIARAHLTARKRQTMVSILGVALGVGFFIAMAAMMQGFQRYFVTKVIDVSPHIVMRDEYRSPPLQPAERAYGQGAVAIQGVRPKEELRGIKDAGRKIEILSQIPGVAVAPSLRGQAILRYGSTDLAATLVGIEPERERRVSNLERDLTGGTLDALRSSANGVILGDGLARKLGITLHESLMAVSPTGIVMRMKVVGIFHTGITTIDNFEGYALLKKVQILQQRANVINQISIKIPDVTKASAIARQIESLHGYRTESWEEVNQNVLGIFVVQNAIIYSTVGAIMIVAGFGIFNIISTVIHEKTRDIAILKSLGLSEGDLRRIFLIEGMAVGAIGALIGWVLGFILTEALGTVRFRIEGFVTTEGFVLYRWIGHYLIAGSMAFATASLAAWLPASRAAKLRPVEIIRGAA